MKSYVRLMAVVILGFSLLACNLSSALTPVVPAPTSVSGPVEEQSFEAPEFDMEGDEDDDIDMSPTPTTEGMLPEENLFDICALISPSDAETFLGEPVNEPINMDGICVFNNARDGLYTFSVAAAQDEQAVSILEGQASLLDAAGIQMDEANLNEVKSLADQLDYRGVFTKLATTAKDSSSITAKLFAGGGNDIVYWSWVSVPPRQQGSFVAVRKTTVVNISLEVPESMEETVLLKQCNGFAGSIFERLPDEFSIFSSMNEDDTFEPTPTSETAIEIQSDSTPVETLVVPGLPAPILVSPDDGATFDIYPRATTLLWEPVDGAAKYLVEIMACAPNDTDTCFSHPMLEKTTRETIETMYAFNFVGEQTGKWRVIPIDASGELGNPSEWRIFLYTK
ncbi:MAG: hypothetical protein GX577_08270 [Leptolinea sp.]|nr:hypothetical protein [Leptolinea sp.]